jgi:hypothetical protein
MTLSLSAVLAVTLFAAADEPRLRIEGNGTDLAGTPLLAALPEALDVPDGSYRLVSDDNDGPPLPATIDTDRSHRQLACVLDRLGAEQSRRFRLVAAVASGSNPGIEASRTESGGLAFNTGGKPFATYVLGERKPYLYPLIGPTGAPFTRAYPMAVVPGEDQDHPHQRSFWFTHGDVNGVDFWASDPLNRASSRQGTIRETGRPRLLAGPVFALLRTTDDWLDAEGRKVCEDERTLRLWDAGQARFLDLEVTIRASEGPVTFGDTKEGTFGLRVPSSLDVTRNMGGRIVNAEGIKDQAAWGKASPWVDYTGPVEGQTVGIAILDHPDSFRHPTTWHVRDYGLFAANPFGYHDFGMDRRGDHTVAEGQTITFRYRVVLHTGDTGQAGIAAHYAAFAQPPRVVVEPTP